MPAEIVDLAEYKRDREPNDRGDDPHVTVVSERTKMIYLSPISYLREWIDGKHQDAPPDSDQLKAIVEDWLERIDETWFEVPQPPSGA